MRDSPLTPAEIASTHADRPDWEIVDGRLHRVVEFRNFSEAFGFMTRVALIAEKLDHHPDWSNSWNRVSIDISSHDAEGLTARCFELAAGIDGLLP